MHRLALNSSGLDFARQPTEFMKLNVAFFGEAEKGMLASPVHVKSVAQLADTFGHPPQESLGIPLAIQALLFERSVFFFRVQDEGFGTDDYLEGIHKLERHPHAVPLHALCMPGVGDSHILEATSRLVETQGTLLLTTEQDLYDYLTH